MNEEYYEQLESVILQKSKILPDFVVQDQNLFVLAVSYLVYAFLNRNIIDNQNNFFIQVPVRELGNKVKNQARNFNQQKAAINDTLGLFLRDSIRRLNRTDLKVNDHIWYLPNNSSFNYRSGIIKSIIRNNDSLDIITKRENVTYGEKGDAWKIDPLASKKPMLIDNFCNGYFQNNIIQPIQYKSILILGFNPNETVTFPFQKMEQNGFEFSRHKILSPLHYATSVSDIKGVAAIRSYDAIVVLGDKCSEDVMTKIRNRKSDCRVIVIDTENPDSRIFTQENTFSFSQSDLAYFYNYREPVAGNVLIDFPELSNIFTELRILLGKYQVDRYEKPLMSLMTKMCTKIFPLTESQLDRYIEKFLDSVETGQEAKNNIETFLYENLASISEFPKMRYIRETEPDFCTFWNYDDKNELLDMFPESNILPHWHGYIRKAAKLQKKAAKNTIICFDTILINDKLEKHLRESCFSGIFTIMMYRGLDENLWNRYLKNQIILNQQIAGSLRSIFEDEFDYEINQAPFGEGAERKLEDYIEQGDSIWDLFGSNNEENVQTQFQEKYTVTFDNGSESIINGTVIYDKDKCSIGDVFDIIEEGKLKDGKVEITYFEPGDQLFEEIVRLYLGANLYNQCLEYSSKWKELLGQLAKKYDDKNLLYDELINFRFKSSRGAFNNYFRECSPDFPQKQNLKAILNLCEHHELIGQDEKEKYLAARNASDDRRKAGRIVQNEIFDWYLNQPADNWQIINKMSPEKLNSIKTDFIRSGNIEKIKLMKRKSKDGK